MKPSRGSLPLAMTCLLVASTAAFAGSSSVLDPYANIEAPKTSKKAPKSRAKVELPPEETTAKTYVTMPAEEQPAKTSKFFKHKEKETPVVSEEKAEKAPKQHKSREAETTYVSEKSEKSQASGGGMMEGFKDIGSGCGKCVKGAGAGMAAPFKAAGAGITKGGKAVSSGTKKVGEAVSDGCKSAGGFFAKGAKAFGEKTAAAAGSVHDAIGGGLKASKEKIAGLPNPLHHDKKEGIPGAPKLTQPGAPPQQAAHVPQPKVKAPKVAHGGSHLSLHMPKLWGHRAPEVPPAATASEGGVQ